MVAPNELPKRPGGQCQAFRLVNSKFPPIALFDDVANADEFETLYQLQALTNPRLQNETGRLELIARSEIPFGIPGCSYATAPFTHVNPAGSRFSDGSYGVLYLASTMDTALAEVRYHQDRYWSNVDALSYERFVFRGLACQFDEREMLDATAVAVTDPIYDSDDYSAGHRLGRLVKEGGYPGLRYRSVRRPGSDCWALMTPRPVSSIVQTAHFEMIWNGRISSVSTLSEI
ncbi:RES domain-containing protein [Stutzerimonas zhaodongensis]|uniref:RES domain-containing protein n=1 Tax=Stutzerimonas zhaodongensis TaxID=1176257 RepID=A0A3M2HJL5_9GAMM|nr:RES family NAD+ phosphorylase [Stutzerimonas zhaodongensis]MCQ4317749.1 RES family NAD+ phosphorylase [Stutzerimonas zhaodongensis]RMH87569.1 RES domain-containing protein [Stutzerimonas zhaodongensis]